VSTHSKELLHFLAPGLVQRLRNALSTIQGRAQSEDDQGGVAKGEILAATKRAQEAVQVLRCVSEERGAVHVGLLLPRLVEVLAVPMGERGLTLAWQHSSKEPPARVNGTLLAETVVSGLKAIAEGLPAGFGGNVVVDLCAQGSEQVEILIELVPGSGLLPFQVDLLSVQQELQKALSPHGGLVVLMGWKLSLHLPAVRAD